MSAGPRGRFLAAAYPGQVVAVSDIGADELMEFGEKFEAALRQ